VLAVLGARPDGRGVTGLVPGAVLRPLSPYFTPRPAVLDQARSIAELGVLLRPGDVLLVEQQGWADAARTRLGPAELDPLVRAAIRAVVETGVVVVEPAGNGDVTGANGYDVVRDLGVPAAGSPGDSRALMVGAGRSEAGGGIDRTRTPFSNFGSRVDLQGYGEGVVTAGVGDLQLGPPTRRYTGCFSGTSSASATVAAAAAALQASAIARTGAPLAPEEVRRRLVVTGLAQDASVPGSIGPRPLVSAAVPAVAATLAPIPEAIRPGPLAVGWSSDPLPAGRPDDELLVDGTPVASLPPGPSHSVRVDLGGEGQRTVAVRIRDRSGAEVTSQARVLVDGTPPPPPALTFPAQGAQVPAGALELAWDSRPDASAGVGSADDVVSLDGREVGRLAAGTGRLAVEVAAGQHRWSVRSLDRLGNASLAEGSFAALAPPAPPARVPPPAVPRPPAGPVAPRSPAPTPTAAPAARPAVRVVRASWSRRSGRLVIRLPGLAPRAVVLVGSRRVRVTGGRAVIAVRRPGALRLRITARDRTPVVLRLVLRSRGPIQVRA
jgi:hypothetical protein